MPLQNFDTNIPKSLIFPCLKVVAHQIDVCVMPDEDGLEIFRKCLKWRRYQQEVGNIKKRPEIVQILPHVRYWFARDGDPGSLSYDKAIKGDLQREADTAIGTTRHGLVLCSSPVVSQPGDQVYLLDTLSSPVLLRPLTASRYRMVGVCGWIDARGAPCWDRFMSALLHDEMSNSDWEFLFHEEPGFSAKESDCLYPGFVDRRAIEIY